MQFFPLNSLALGYKYLKKTENDQQKKIGIADDQKKKKTQISFHKKLSIKNSRSKM